MTQKRSTVENQAIVSSPVKLDSAWTEEVRVGLMKLVSGMSTKHPSGDAQSTIGYMHPEHREKGRDGEIQ